MYSLSMIFYVCDSKKKVSVTSDKTGSPVKETSRQNIMNYSCKLCLPLFLTHYVRTNTNLIGKPTESVRKNDRFMLLYINHTKVIKHRVHEIHLKNVV